MLDARNCPVRAPETQSVTDKDKLWKQILAWIRSEKSGIKPGDEFTVKQVADAFPKEQYDSVAKTLRRMSKYKENGIEHLDHGRYKRSPAEKDPFEGQL